MKRIFFAIILSAISLSLSAQWFGNGLTAGTAYYGIVNSTFPMQAWNTTNYPGGIIYVGRSTVGQNDLEVATGGILNIGPGITVRFCTTSSDLRITGTGVLSANGSASNYITFTKDQQATWGHITFEASTGISTINYSIIEFGYKNGGSIEGYGGGIHANTNNLSISNSTIRNNYALFGGGLFVNKNMSPSINRCYFYNNQSGDAGGGAYFWNGSASVITNCIFENNHCLELSVPYYTGGGLAAQSGTSLKILNCTFVNNTSTQTLGKSVMLYGSAADLVSNCILWNSSSTGNQFYLSGANTVQYTAVSVNIPSGTGNLLLSTINSDPTGPNFKGLSGPDFSLNYNSPCRNAGTAIGAPASDYFGRTRIVPYDMGAFEFLATVWKTTASTTDWNTSSNWDGGIPTTGNDIIIPSGATNYPINTPAPDLTLSGGANMTLGPGAKTTLGNFVNNGTLTLQSDGTSGDASFIVGSYSGNGATVELFLTGGEAGGSGTKTFRWHFISTPVTSLAVSTFSPTYTLDLARWYDDRVSGTLISGWVAYDGYVYATGGSDGARQFSTLQPGLGYDYYDNADDKYTFNGQLNTSDVTMSLSYAANDALHGFNLLGNPFSCGLDWSQIIADPSYPLYTSKGLYFTRNNVQCSYVGGVGIPGDVTGIIPPMQGFFVKTNAAGNSIKIPASARTQGAIHFRYKGVNTIPLVRLTITENNTTDETVVRFDNLAKSGLDYDFDMLKMFISTTNTQIYSSYGGTNYSINGLPFPDSTLSIPIVVNFLTTGTHTINATQLQYLDNYTVTLTDKSTGFVADLKTSPVLTFTATAGTISDRFFLKFTNISTGVDDPVVTSGKFNIYPSFGFINIQTLADEWDGKDGSVNVLDLSGKIVGSLTNVTFSRNSLTSVQANLEKGLYIVELKSGIKRYVGKVVVR